jgi:hypothetical protein
MPSGVKKEQVTRPVELFYIPCSDTKTSSKFKYGPTGMFKNSYLWTAKINVYYSWFSKFLLNKNTCEF